jgi:HD-GYP domain-containing protein (c-di-GMP phosphodiesterase class II)
MIKPLDIEAGTSVSNERRSIREFLSTIKSIHSITDLNVLLEKILHEGRLFVNADAGTLYTVRDSRLFFSYIENDTLFPQGLGKDRYVYSNNSIPLNRSSIAGYVGLTGEPLLIDDVYDIRSNVSYSFNPSYDRMTSYRTQSLLVVPLTRTDGTVIGVMQLINKQDGDGQVKPFSSDDRLYASYFAQHAADALEKADLSRQMVSRMVEMAELRDQHESRQHARRVGDYAVELYDAWAQAHEVPLNERTVKKDIFRAAAMLHDVGKVALSNDILQKHGEFTEDEKIEMYKHTVYGARLFRDRRSAWDRIAFEVVLNHHERWNGTGYPGHIKNVHMDPIEFGTGKRGKEIPLSARIVAIADVYDALTSARSYKDAWSEDTARMYIKKQGDKLFDPELVEYFVNMKDVLAAIQYKHREDSAEG